MRLSAHPQGAAAGGIASVVRRPADHQRPAAPKIRSPASPVRPHRPRGGLNSNQVVFPESPRGCIPGLLMLSSSVSAGRTIGLCLQPEPEGEGQATPDRYRRTWVCRACWSTRHSFRGGAEPYDDEYTPSVCHSLIRSRGLLNGPGCRILGDSRHAVSGFD